jgi:biotin carboxyl carrier protein
MPGTVLKVAVKAGQTVKKNQLLVVIEAMKMENEIVSPRDAVIAGVMVTKGSTLNAGEPMISLE